MRISDWSSDVCSSDLADGARRVVDVLRGHTADAGATRSIAATVLGRIAVAAAIGADDRHGLLRVHAHRAEGVWRQRCLFDRDGVWCGVAVRQSSPGQQRIECRFDRVVAVQTVGEQRVREIRSEEHTSELQSLMRISYAVFCLDKKKK